MPQRLELPNQVNYPDASTQANYLSVSPFILTNRSNESSGSAACSFFFPEKEQLRRETYVDRPHPITLSDVLPHLGKLPRYIIIGFGNAADEDCWTSSKRMWGDPEIIHRDIKPYDITNATLQSKCINFLPRELFAYHPRIHKSHYLLI